MKQEGGFTFLETLISLLLMGMILAASYGAFRVGVRASERGEGQKEENQRTRAVLSLMRRQLKSAYPYHLRDQGESWVYFFGSGEGVSFIASAGWPEAGGFERVTYFLQGEGSRRELWLRVSWPVFPADLIEDRKGRFSQQTLLLEGVEEIAWQFLRERGEELEWQDGWDGREEQTLPRAVRVAWKARVEGLLESWEMEVPLMVQTSARGIVGRRARRRLGRED